eukprot:gene10078-11154_t
MISSVKSTILAQWRRVVKYSVVGTAVGGATGWLGGYLVMKHLMKETEFEIQEKIEANIWELFQPPVKFYVDWKIKQVKQDGIDSCVFVGASYGLGAGISLGITSASLHLCFRLAKFVFMRR